AYVLRFLRRHGVDVRLQAQAVRVEPRCIHLAGGTSVEGFTIIWTAGVRPPQVVLDLPLLHAADGRIQTDDTFRALDLSGRPLDDVHVIGDCAAVSDGHGDYHPRLAQVAVGSGRRVGENLVRQARGEAPRPYTFHLK